MDHVTARDLELYSLGHLGSARDAGVEEHLLICEACRVRLLSEDSIKLRIRAALSTRVASHTMTQGVIDLWLEPRRGYWIARIEGPRNLESFQGSSWDAALDLLLKAFRERFPDHVCAGECTNSEIL